MHAINPNNIYQELQKQLYSIRAMQQELRTYMDDNFVDCDFREVGYGTDGINNLYELTRKLNAESYSFNEVMIDLEEHIGGVSRDIEDYELNEEYYRREARAEYEYEQSREYA